MSSLKENHKEDETKVMPELCDEYLLKECLENTPPHNTACHAVFEVHRVHMRMRVPTPLTIGMLAL